MMGRVEAELSAQNRVAILLEALRNTRLVIQRWWVEVEAA
jgi:hypothetical protein